MPNSVAVRRVYVAQTIGATVDGIALSTAVLYFNSQVGISAHFIGVVLSAASVAALVFLMPIGILADVVGLRRAAITLSSLVAGALLIFAVARDGAMYAVGAVLFMVSQAGIGAVRHAIVASRGAPDARVRGRAVLHTLLNGGFGVGTLVGASVAVIGDRLPFVVAYVAASSAALACAGIFATIPETPAAIPDRSSRPGRLVVWQTPRFVAVTALAAVIQVTMPVLSILLPLWVVDMLRSPGWVAPAAIALNTAIVLLTQTHWAARMRTDSDACRALLAAAIGLLLGCTLYGLAAIAEHSAAIVLIGLGTVGLTIGEVSGGAGTWHLAFARLPTSSPGQYHAFYGSSGSVGRLLGPLVALPLVLAFGALGWITVGCLMAAAAGVLAHMAHRGARSDAQTAGVAS